jgi:hypothetical protein
MTPYGCYLQLIQLVLVLLLLLVPLPTLAVAIITNANTAAIRAKLCCRNTGVRSVLWHGSVLVHPLELAAVSHTAAVIPGEA